MEYYTTTSNVYSEFIYENISQFLLNDSNSNDNNNTNNNTATTALASSLPSVQNISTTQYAVNITYIIVAIFGVLGNLLSLVIICTHPPIRRRLPNYYFINQTIADLLVSLMLVPSVTSGLISYGYSNQILCLIWQSRGLFVGLYDVSVYSIVALSFERYLEVVHPIWHRVNVTKGKVIVSLIVVWLFGVTYKYAYILPTTRAVNGVCNIAIYYPNKAASTAAGLVNFSVDYFFPLLLILICYIKMWRGLHNKVFPRHCPTAQGNHGPKAKQSISSRARRNIFVTLVIILFFFVACNTHKQILLLLKSLNIITLDLTSVNFNVSQILAFMNATIEPYIYLMYHREFQSGFRKLFKREKISGSHSSQTQPSNDTALKIIVSK